LADRGDELYNVASNAAYEQVYLAYDLFFKMFILFNFSIFSDQLPVNNSWYTSSVTEYHSLRNRVLADYTTFIICDNVTRNRRSAMLYISCDHCYNFIIFFSQMLILS
jgi:hypothetical protein